MKSRRITKARWLCLCVITFAASAWADSIGVGRFSQADVSGWQPKQFAGHTQYRLVTIDGVSALRADSQQAASGLVKKVRIDLHKTPWLTWRWRIDNRLPAADETTKQGDDYAARLYVVVDGGLFFWNTRALNYVWANSSTAGMSWPNAFAGSNAMMLALRSQADDTGTWVEERRNVREDLRQALGEDIRYIDAVAIMTDTDNNGGAVTSWYGDIRFTAE
ncbi:MAG TPA: DUF3047 domain-containing protein [Pseudomonadales bacterium]